MHTGRGSWWGGVHGGGVTGKFPDLQPVVTGPRSETLRELVKNANSPDTTQIYGIGQPLGGGPRNLPLDKLPKCTWEPLVWAAGHGDPFSISLPAISLPQVLQTRFLLFISKGSFSNVLQNCVKFYFI